MTPSVTCQRARESFADLLDPRSRGADAPSEAVTAARAHLASCPDCQRQFSELTRTLLALDALPAPTPSPALRRDFYAMLEEEKHSAASIRAADAASRRRRRLGWWRWVALPLGACALLFLGFLAGRRQQPAGPVPNPAAPAVAADPAARREIDELRTKVDRLETMNQLVAASLLQQQRPATDRLRDVLTTASQPHPSDRAIDELITSLALDSSANVRLSALQALYPHANQEVVRAGVLASLSRESNPLVQVAMIDFLAAARDANARPALERMSVSEAIDQNVRTAAKRALAQL